MSDDSAALRLAASIKPVGLRTEYMINPSGLDLSNPRLSWALQPASGQVRGASQTAYHLLVASFPRMLHEGRADLWDSGEVASAQTAHISYEGRPLVSRQQCHWSVRVADERGVWSAWSGPARFTLGLLDPSEWTAQWIGTGEAFTCQGDLTIADKVAPPDNTMPDPWFRRGFLLPEKPLRATAQIASVGYHELFVNGRKVGDAVLAPSVTDNSKRARYVSYEIADHLVAGENVIGLWLGTGWSIFPIFATEDKPRAPIVYGQFDFDFGDGSSQRLVTDASWKTHPSPNTLLGVWYFMNFGGECYDAGREIAGWAEPGLDETAWKPAVVVHPDLTVSADKVEPNRLIAELRPVSITAWAGGAYRVDLGRNFAGWTEIALEGEPGDRVELHFSEQPDAEITHRLRSVFVIGPSGRGVFRNRFNYSSGRWVTIRGLRRPPQAADIRGWLVRTDFQPAAAFACSQPLLNRIYETTSWTLENLTLGGYIVDCPQRERMGYGGDGHATITTALSMFEVGAFCTKWAEDWRDTGGRAPIWGHNRLPTEAGGGAREDGNLPYTAPTYWGGGGPIWSGFCVHLPWEIHRRYGDTQVLHANFEMIQSWLSFLEGKAKGNLLQRWGGEWDFLGDWLWPEARGVNGDTRESLFLNNSYWIYNLQLAADIARIIGRHEQEERWRERADAVRRAVHAEFFNPSDQSYVNGFQAKLAMALLANVPPPELRPAVWKRLEHEILEVRRGHIHAGITGGALLFKTLMDAGRDDLLYAMVSKEDYPGWGFMLRQDATTIWEEWGNAESLLHSSFIYVGAWFIHGVLGIQPHPEQAGFTQFVIRPGLVVPGELTWARGHYDSIRGRIGVAWDWRDDRYDLAIEVPPNTTAFVHLPTTETDSVREGGRRVAVSPHVKISGRTDGRLVLEVGSGRHRFLSTLKIGRVASGRLAGMA